MIEKTRRYRWLQERLPRSDKRRLVVLTGARQTGKTTLVRALYPELAYHNLDHLEDREALLRLRTSSWSRIVGSAVIDEAQKLPAVFDKVKWAFDQGEISFSVLTGSSRILLLDRVQETLAGRAFLYDLWPLMASELRAPAGDRPSSYPLLHHLLAEPERLSDLLAAEPPLLLGADEEERLSAVEHLLTWGGMPELLQLDDEEERRQWLRSYRQTFLERDLTDLVRLRDLLPFQTLQRLAMLRSASLLSYSELARDAGIAVNTARRYLEYLRLSYQTILVQPWRSNEASRLVKTPKLYWLDLGILRQGIRRWGPADGAMFETLVVAEIHKWVRTMTPDVELFFYRTRSGLEVDLVLDTPRGMIGVEIKQRRRAAAPDIRPLQTLAARYADRWCGGLVILDGGEVQRLSPENDIWAVPIHRLV